MTKNYMREIDLNPPAALGGPVTSPFDPRALHYFGFSANGQEIDLVQPFAGNPRVLVSFHYANQPTAAALQPPPPVDAVVDFAGGPPSKRWDADHDRAHVLVWLDPAAAPPAGQPATVRVSAWAK